MMLFLTGSLAPQTKQGGDTVQNDVTRSLGGYVSSTPVPSGAANKLFDEVSSFTLQNKKDETIGIALVNTLARSVENITLKIIGEADDLANFAVAVVPIANMVMEQIADRYDEPIQAEFHDASFTRAGVTIQILNPADIGEEFAIMPMGEIVDGIKECSIKATMAAIEDHYNASEEFQLKGLTKDTFRIERRDDETVEPENCGVVTTGILRLSYSGKFENSVDNSALLVETLAAGAAVGVWIKRSFKRVRRKEDTTLIQEYDAGTVKQNLESIEFVFNYTEVTP